MKVNLIKKMLIYLCVFFLPYTTFRIFGLKLSEIFMSFICIISILASLENSNLKVDKRKSPHIKFLVFFSIAIIISMCINFFDMTYLEKIGIEKGIYYSYEYGWIFKIIRLFLVVNFTSILLDFFNKSRKNVKSVINVYILSTVLVDLYALLKLGSQILFIKFGIARTALFAIEPSEAGFINSVSIIMIIYRMLIEKKYNIKNILIFFILFFTQIYIGSAAALGFLLISIVMVFVYRAQKDKKHTKYIIFVFLFVFLIIVYLIVNTNIFDKIYNYKKYSNIEGASTVERVAAIQTGIKMWIQKPLFGFGWGNYGWFVDKYKTNPLYRTVPGGDFSANNQYVVILSELGIVGNIIFLIFIFRIYKYIKFLNKQEMDNELNCYFYTFFTTYIYVMLSNFTLNAIYSYQFWISISVILYLDYYIEEKNKNVEKKNDGF